MSDCTWNEFCIQTTDFLTVYQQIRYCLFCIWCINTESFFPQFVISWIDWFWAIRCYDRTVKFLVIFLEFWTNFPICWPFCIRPQTMNPGLVGGNEIDFLFTLSNYANQVENFSLDKVFWNNSHKIRKMLKSSNPINFWRSMSRTEQWNFVG